jgi:DNA (cytosine-5)-methyltransferase 1
VSKLRVLDLFSGIGGFSLGLERTGGFETVAFCEIEEFPRRVLAKHWPNVPCYRDVRELTAERLAADGIAVDVITGGFPCQDVSCAGKQAGVVDGTRSGLWSEIVRLTCELAPRFVIVENVANLLAGPSERPGGWFGRVLGDLAACGYNAEWANIPAAFVGAPQRRERVWLVAYSTQDNVEQVLEAAQTTGKPRGGAWGCWPNRLDQSFVCREANGLPGDAHRIAALGNAVVPQIPELIGNAILAALNTRAPTPSPLRAEPAGAADMVAPDFPK